MHYTKFRKIKRGNKYGAKKTEYNGNKYDSKAEAEYAINLDWLLQDGQVKSWERQIRYDLCVDGEKIGAYILDFKVVLADGSIEHVDVKGYRHGLAYQFFKWKKKHMKAQYGIDVLERE